MRIGHRFVDGVANRACRTGIVGSQRCALVAPCVGPVLTKPMSGAVPSHFAVLVAVAEDSRLIALWASAHCYESNPYRLPFAQSRIACGVAFSVNHQQTSPSVPIKLSTNPLRSSERSTAITSSIVIFVILLSLSLSLSLLVNLAVWSDQP